MDAAFFAAVDPVTLLFTDAVADDPLGAATPLFLDNEFGHEDVDKFASLAGPGDRVSSLDRATRGDRSASHRYREIMAPTRGDTARPLPLRRLVPRAGESAADRRPRVRFGRG